MQLTVVRQARSLAPWRRGCKRHPHQRPLLCPPRQASWAACSPPLHDAWVPPPARSLRPWRPPAHPLLGVTRWHARSSAPAPGSPPSCQLRGPVSAGQGCPPASRRMMPASWQGRQRLRRSRRAPPAQQSRSTVTWLTPPWAWRRPGHHWPAQLRWPRRAKAWACPDGRHWASPRRHTHGQACLARLAGQASWAVMWRLHLPAHRRLAAG